MGQKSPIMDAFYDKKEACHRPVASKYRGKRKKDGKKKMKKVYFLGEEVKRDWLLNCEKDEDIVENIKKDGITYMVIHGVLKNIFVSFDLFKTLSEACDYCYDIENGDADDDDFGQFFIVSDDAADFLKSYTDQTVIYFSDCDVYLWCHPFFNSPYCTARFNIDFEIKEFDDHFVIIPQEKRDDEEDQKTFEFFDKLYKMAPEV